MFQTAKLPGLDKEPMIATKTVNTFLVGLVQIGSYAALGVLPADLWVAGGALGIGASVGNYLGKRLLQRISSLLFRRLVIAVMVVSGLVLLYQQSRQWLTQ